MSKRKQRNTPRNGVQRARNPQEAFLMAGVGVFLKNGDLAHMTIQNEYGAIVVNRSTLEKVNTFAIGFGVDGADNGDDEDDDFDEEEYREVVEKYIKWLD